MSGLRSEQTEWYDDRDRYRQAAFDLLYVARILSETAGNLARTTVSVAEPAQDDIAQAIELLRSLPKVKYGKGK